MTTKLTEVPLPIADGDVENLLTEPGKDGVRKTWKRVNWGSWRVEFWPDDKGLVKLFWNSRLLMQSHGIVAFQQAQEYARHFHGRSYHPCFTGKCLADLTPGQRQEACLIAGNKGVKTTGQKPPQAPWKGAGR